MVQLLKFILILCGSSVFSLSLSYAKPKKNTEDLLTELMSVAQEPEKLPKYSEVTQLINSLKTKWEAERPQRDQELQTWITELEARGTDEDLITVKSIKTDQAQIDSSRDTSLDINSVLRIYLNSYLETSFLEKHGISSGESTYFGAEGNRELTLELSASADAIKKDTLKVLLWAKDNYPEDFSQALNGTDLYETLISNKETVTQFADITAGRRSSFNLNNCYSKEEDKGVSILLNASLIDQGQIISCNSKPKKTEVFNCFPQGSPFLKLLGNSKKNINYFFAEGTKKDIVNQDPNTIDENSNNSHPANCVFLGGSWILDKQNSAVIAKESKVKILTPDNRIQILSSIELTQLRKKWLENEARLVSEQATLKLLAVQKKSCGF